MSHVLIVFEIFKSILLDSICNVHTLITKTKETKNADTVLLLTFSVTDSLKPYTGCLQC